MLKTKCQSRGSRGPPRARDKWAATVSPGKENPGRYKIYIFKVPKQGHPGVGVDAKVMSIMNSFIKDIFEKLAGSAPGNVQKPTPGSKSPSSREGPTPGTDTSSVTYSPIPGRRCHVRSSTWTLQPEESAPPPWTAQACSDTWRVWRPCK